MHFVQLGFNAVDGKSAASDDCLIAAPAGKIIFKYPFNETITMALTNAHTKPVMWALKTNALRRIAAQPTCGVLPSHATVHLKIGLLEAPPSHTFGMDKMAIDYCIAEEGIALFDRAFMRRKATLCDPTGAHLYVWGFYQEPIGSTGFHEKKDRKSGRLLLCKTWKRSGELFGCFKCFLEQMKAKNTVLWTNVSLL
ncbi:unnamed protein product [Toxocara canis]|uniref:Major sperm protein n=1 Tax=Toxocara canis TaxID=6265 RepID=A0A183V2C0_TOXCA|nr:unnamed protein product [Toxocara canis]